MSLFCPYGDVPLKWDDNDCIESKKKGIVILNHLFFDNLVVEKWAA